jgi:hypothetical protein
MEGWTSTAHLLGGDLREASTVERSFLAGETDRNFVFEIINWKFQNVIHHGFENTI